MLITYISVNVMYIYVCSIYKLMNIFSILLWLIKIACLFVLFLLIIVLSVLRFTVSDYSFGIFKLFLLAIVISLGWAVGFLRHLGQHFGYIMGISFIGSGMVFNVTFNNISVISWRSVI